MDDLVRPDGTSVHLLASRDPAGHLHLFAGHEEDARALRGFDRVGAQLALADLDQDGVTEVITTRDSVDDSISIWSWRDHQLTSRLKIPAALPVRALTVCPSGERGLRPIVAIVGAEVWLVR
jgi:hypothetical protein